MPLSKALITFINVVEAGSLGKAATVLHTSIPPLSRQIRLLEERLRKKSFTRESSGLILTPEGMSFYKSIKPAADIILNATHPGSRHLDEVSVGSYGITPLQKYSLLKHLPSVLKNSIQICECRSLHAPFNHQLLLSKQPVQSSIYPHSIHYIGSACLLTSNRAILSDIMDIPFIQHSYDITDKSDYNVIRSQYNLSGKIIISEDILFRLDMMRTGKYISFVASEFSEFSDLQYDRHFSMHRDISLPLHVFLYSKVENAEFFAIKNYFDTVAYYKPASSISLTPYS